MTIRGVVFDMDGLMFNSEDVYWLVGSEIMRKRGHEYTRELADAMMGRPPRSAFEVMIEWYKLDCDWKELARESEENFIRFMVGQIQPMPGLLDLLDALEAAKIPKAIGTSSSRVLVDALLPMFDLQSRFNFILSSENIVHGKPHPEPYLMALEKAGVSAHEAVVIENAPLGIQAAVAAGIFTIAINTGILENEVLEKAGADIVLTGGMEELYNFYHCIGVFPCEMR